MPNHCFNSVDNNPIETETDWNVIFNPDVNGQSYYPYVEKDVDSSLGIAGCGSTDTSNSTQEKKRYALVIGLDGVVPEALMNADTPVLDALIANGMYSMEAMTQVTGITESVPGWASILTGVESLEHYWFRNDSRWKTNPAHKTFLWHGK